MYSIGSLTIKFYIYIFMMNPISMQSMIFTQSFTSSTLSIAKYYWG